MRQEGGQCRRRRKKCKITTNMSKKVIRNYNISYLPNKKPQNTHIVQMAFFFQADNASFKH